ncbi:MAG: hypothetical protein IKA36_03285 [Clostridia bacterium]|nr:hypothetical protein [Clostridia bacterium]
MIDAILGVIGTILYPLFSIIFGLVDLLQNIFRAFAGVGTIYYNEGGGIIFGADLKPITSGEKGKGILDDDNGGIVYYLLRSDLVMNLVWSIATLALILLVVFTVIAFIKNVYAPKSKSWQEIMGLSLKGLFNFILVPVVCLIGIILGNILLNAIDGATSSGGTMTMSRKLFLSAAADANIVRSEQKVTYKRANDIAELYQDVFGTLPEGIKIIPESDMPRKVDIFGNVTDKPDKDAVLSEEQGHVDGTREDVVNLYANMIDEAFGSGKKDIGMTDVWGFYNLWGVNYLVLAVGGVFILYALGSITFGMIKRLFMLIMLFVISPAACAMYPLDEGNACKQVTGDFKKNTISAYGAVAGMNIFFSISPLVNNINLSSATLFQSIVHLILLTCGLFMVKDFISMISNYFGAGNAYADGSSLMKQTKDKIGGTANKAIGTFARAKGAHDAGGSFWGSLGRSAVRGSLGTFTGIKTDQIKEDYKTGMTKDTDTDIGVRKLFVGAVAGISRKAEANKAKKEALNKRVDEAVGQKLSTETEKEYAATRRRQAKLFKKEDKEAQKEVRAQEKAQEKAQGKEQTRQMREDRKNATGGGNLFTQWARGVASNFGDAEQEKFNKSFEEQYKNAKSDKEKEQIKKEWTRQFNTRMNHSTNVDKKRVTADDFDNKVLVETNRAKNKKNAAIASTENAYDNINTSKMVVQSLDVQKKEVQGNLAPLLAKDESTLTAEEKAKKEQYQSQLEGIQKALTDAMKNQALAITEADIQLEKLGKEFGLEADQMKKFVQKLGTDFDKIANEELKKSVEKVGSEFEGLIKAIKKLKATADEKK